MNIAFSTEWFLTIPGILITCGVILLIIALIMFIVSSMKGKSSSSKASVDEEVGSVSNDQSQVSNQVESVVVDSNNTQEGLTGVNDFGFVQDSQQTLNNDSVKETSFINESISTDSVEPVLETTNIDDIIPEIIVDVPVVDTPVIDVPSIQPLVDSDISNSLDNNSNVDESLSTVNLSSESSDVLEMPDATNLEETSVNIYGGVTPITEAINVESEVSRPIYGGADPLEATQNLPRVDVHHEPYSGGIGPVVDIQPMEEVVSTPSNNTVVEEVVSPIVEQTVSEVLPTPSIVEIPDVEQL